MFFGVFMVLMLLIMCTFIYQVIVSNKRLSKVEDAAEQTLKFFDPLSNRTIGREESKAIIRESVTRSSTMMKYAILKIRYENNLSREVPTTAYVELYVLSITTVKRC